ncbi:MAG: ATP-binding protein [Candidatus Magnetoovum sp. WYHC-5]|nr:ATP-binding protein [Candidatus Magnetoovum sp. WYHC-5]
MKFRRLLSRIIVVSFLVIFFAVYFYFSVKKTLHTHLFNTEQISLITKELIYFFTLFPLSILLASLFFVIRDYRKNTLFLNDLKRFLKTVHEGNLRKKMFYYYPDLEEVYEYLNMLYDDLKCKFALMEKETAQLNATLENIPDSLIIIDNKNTIVYSNEKANELFKETRGKLVGKPIIEVLRNAELNTALDDVKLYDKSEIIEIIFDRFNEERYLQVRISPFYRKNDLTGLVILFHDMTGLKKLESMRRDFVANVTHEIKTPITAIRGFAETLLDGAINDKENAVKFLTTIKAHAERLDRLVDDLMVISKLELGVIKLKKNIIDLSIIVDTVIDTLNNKAKQKGLYIESVIDVEPPTIYADKDRLTQVLLNLADNALKFTQKGGVEIGYKKDDRGIHYIYVCDTGIGVPKRYISRLGERFFRVDASRSRELGGTGLGLAIVKHIVKAHDWELKTDSHEGIGTTFKILIHE